MNKVMRLILLLVCIMPFVVRAHDARPVVVSINESLPGVFQYSVTVPPTVEAGNLPDVAWPDNCARQGDVEGAGALVCDGGLYGRALTLEYPYYNPSLATFYRLTTLAGDTSTAMLSPTLPVWNIPEVPTRANIAFEYLSLGVEHIIGGLDHLLFVLGLLVIARSTRRILWTVTGFTLAHSITLSLSSLGLVNIPIVPVEAAIALSIVFLACEISRDHRDSLTYRYPLIVSFGFGLLHGLGFASALGEIGLVRNEILVSLLFFNLGVEVGQIAFIMAVIAMLALVVRLSRHRFDFSDAVILKRVDLVSAYVIGVPAAYWLIDRVAQFL